MIASDGREYFEAICRLLTEESNRVSFRLCGASCEQWLNAEAAVALNYALSPVLQERQLVIPEKRLAGIRGNRRMDLPIFTLDSPLVDVVIEAKVVYPWADPDIRAKVNQLIAQLNEYSDRIGESRVFGILYSVWADFWSSDLISGEDPRPPLDGTSRDFFARVQRVIDTSLAGIWGSVASQEIIGSQSLTLAGRRVSVGLSATWIGVPPGVTSGVSEGTPNVV